MNIPRHPDHDPKVHALAEQWLDDHHSTFAAADRIDLVWGLAETIQQALDDWMDDFAHGRLHKRPRS